MYALLEKLDRDCIDSCFILWCTCMVVHYNFVHVFGKLYETTGNVASHLFITTTIFVIGLLEICNVIMAIVFGNVLLSLCKLIFEAM